MNEFLSLDWKPRVGVGEEEFQKRGVDEKGGANKIIIQMVRESSFFSFQLGMVESHPLLINANAIDSPRSSPSRGGGKLLKRFFHAFIIVWCTVYAEWEYHGIDIRITRDRDLAFLLRLPAIVRISRLFRYFFLLDRKLKEKKLESKVYQWGLRRFREE